jgi:uncharacterized protein
MHRPRFSLIMMLSALLITGCARSPAALFYLLTPVPPAAPGVPGVPAEASRAWIKVLPVQIPDYLERSQMVTRAGTNQIEVAEYHRWGGSLSDNMTAVLAADLGNYLASERVYAAPGYGEAKPDYLVHLQLLRLDAVPGDRLLLEVRWAILHGTGEGDAVRHQASFSEPLGDRRYESVAAGVSRVLGRLGAQMAQQIVQMSRD